MEVRTNLNQKPSSLATKLCLNSKYLKYLTMLHNKVSIKTNTFASVI